MDGFTLGQVQKALGCTSDTLKSLMAELRIIRTYCRKLTPDEAKRISELYYARKGGAVLGFRRKGRL